MVQFSCDSKTEKKAIPFKKQTIKNAIKAAFLFIYRRPSALKKQNTPHKGGIVKLLFIRRLRHFRLRLDLWIARAGFAWR